MNAAASPMPMKVARGKSIIILALHMPRFANHPMARGATIPHPKFHGDLNCRCQVSSDIRNESMRTAASWTATDRVLEPLICVYPRSNTGNWKGPVESSAATNVTCTGIPGVISRQVKPCGLLRNSGPPSSSTRIVS